VAKGPDRALERPEDGRLADSEDRLHLGGPCEGGHPQLQRRRFRVTRSQVRRGRPPKFTLRERQKVKKIALGRPGDYGLPFSTWSLTKLADYLVRKGVVDDISHEGLRSLLREEGVSFQAMKTWKHSNDPEFEQKKNRILELYEIADGTVKAKRKGPQVVICFDEFGPLNLQPHPGRHWAERGGGGSEPRRRRRATYVRRGGVRHLLAAYDLSTDKLYGHIKTRKGRSEFLAFCRYLRSLYPASVRIAIVLDNFSPHTGTAVEEWAKANNVELAYTPNYASWLNRVEAQFTALRYFCLDGTDYESHFEQASVIRRYIAWRNHHVNDETLRELVKRANVA